MAKTIRDEDLILNIIVKGEKGISAIDKVTASTTRLKMSMNELSEHIKLTKTALANAVPGTENWKRLNKELQESKSRMKELQDQSKATGGALESLSKLKAGTVAAFAAMAGAIRGVSKAIGTIADFEQANANLSTIIGKNVKDIGVLTESAKQLGAATEYTASQVTFLQTELAKLGFKENDITNMQESVLHFATAVGADLSDAASLAGATLRMFGLETSRTEDTLGVLTKATTNSALSFSYLQTAMSIVGPVAKTFGFSVRDTTALLGALANSGFDASSAATATRNILLNLANANGKLATALGGPVKTLPDLIDGLKTLDAQGVDLAKTLELTDKRSVSAFNTFLHGADDVDTLRESLEDVKGVLGDTAEARMDTVQGSIKLLQSAWDGFILSLSGSKGVIKWAIDQATMLVNKLTEFAQGPGGILMRQARENGSIDYSSSDYFRGMGNDERQKVKKTYEQGLAAAEAELKRLEGKSGFRKFFDNALKEEIDEARAAVEFQKTRLASFESFMAAGSGGATPSGAAGGTLSGGSSGGGGNKGNGTDKHQALLDRIMADNETLIDKDLEAADKLLSKQLEDMLKKDENDKKAKLEAFDRKIKDMESGHTLSVQNIRNNFSSQKAAAGIWQSGAIDKAMNEAIIKEDLGYLQALKEKLSVAISEGMIEGADIPDDQKDKLKQKLAETIGKINELTAQDKANNSGIWGGTGGGTLFGISEAQWGQFFYNLEHGKLKADDLANAMTSIGNLANEGFQLASKAIANTNAKEQAAFKEYQKIQENEKKALKNRLDSGLVSQAQYDAEVERMNAEAEAKQEAMKLKQAKREKSLNIIQSIINTAIGVTKTLAQWGIPAGIAPAAIMSAMGAAQTALIAAQPVTGAEAGGYVNTRRAQDGKPFKARLSPDKRGFISSPTVLVGENGGEYVIPAAGLDNPTLRPMLATIETARQAGRLKDLNFEAIYPLSSPIGRESGGYVQSPPPTSTPNVTTAAASRESTRFSEAIETLVRRLAQPIKAEVSMTGRNGIIEKTEEYNRAKNRGKYNG